MDHATVERPVRGPRGRERWVRWAGLCALPGLVACLDLSSVPQESLPTGGDAELGPACGKVSETSLPGSTYVGEVTFCSGGLVCEAYRCVDEPVCTERRPASGCRVPVVRRPDEVITSFAANDAFLYWTTSGTKDAASNYLEDGRLYRMSLASSQLELLADHLSGPNDLMVNERWTVWSEQSPADDSVRFFKMRAGGERTPILGAPTVSGRPLLPRNEDEVWFVQQGLLRASLTEERGAEVFPVEPFAFADTARPSMVLDEQFVYLLVAGDCDEPRIVKAPRAGGAFEPIRGSNVCAIDALLGVVDGQVVFTRDYPLTAVSRLAASGGEPEELALFPAAYNPAAKLHDGFVYVPIGYSEFRPRRLARVSLADPSRRDLVAAFGAPGGDGSWGVDWVRELDSSVLLAHGSFWGSDLVHGPLGKLGHRVLHFTAFNTRQN